MIFILRGSRAFQGEYFKNYGGKKEFYMDGRTNVKRDGQMEEMDGWTTNRRIHQPKRGLCNLEGVSLTWIGTQQPRGERSDVKDSATRMGTQQPERGFNDPWSNSAIHRRTQQSVGALSNP